MTTPEIRKGDYTVSFWDGTSVTRLQDLKGSGAEMKPETIVPLETKDGKLNALILFDGPENGQPTPVTIDLN